MIVMKFGGSSVESAAAIRRVLGHVESCLPRRPAVVVSAMAKTTRNLLAAGGAAAGGDLQAARALAAELRSYHERESGPVTAPGALDGVFDRLFGELDAALVEVAREGVLTPRLADRIAGYGELLSSAILAEALGFAGDRRRPRRLPAGAGDRRSLHPRPAALRRDRRLPAGGPPAAARQPPGGGARRLCGGDARRRHHHSRLRGLGLLGRHRRRRPGGRGGADLDRRRRHPHRRPQPGARRAGGALPELRRGPGARLLGRQEAAPRHPRAGPPQGGADPHPQLAPARSRPAR